MKCQPTDFKPLVLWLWRSVKVETGTAGSDQHDRLAPGLGYASEEHRAVSQSDLVERLPDGKRLDVHFLGDGQASQEPRSR